MTTQLRVGQMEARRRDEYLGLRHGLIGQETTGVGGMAKALRTIPVILKIASDMRELAQKDALLVNFTNPAGLVTQALSKYAADVPAVGVCNVPITAKMHIIEGLEKATGKKIDPAQTELNTLGLTIFPGTAVLPSRERTSGRRSFRDISTTSSRKKIRSGSRARSKCCA